MPGQPVIETPAIERTVTKYYESVESMRKRLGGDPVARDLRMREAKERLVPLSYSVDVAWQRRMQSFNDTVINDPTRGALEPPDKLLLKAINRLEKTNIEQNLQDWLLEADPFKERTDPNAIAARGAKLLESLETCFEIAAERKDTTELQPDLMAMTDWVRTRMETILSRNRPSSPALNVPHQMYLELQGAITRSIDGARDGVRKTAVKAEDPDAVIADWDQDLDNCKSWIRRNSPNYPDLYWWVTCDRVLPSSDTPVQGREYNLRKVFDSRNFRDQIKRFYETIDGNRDTADYVMKVREAAWPVQEAIDLYLRAIDREWHSRQDNNRASLDQALCAVADRVLKEVNFVISSKLARVKVGGSDRRKDHGQRPPGSALRPRPLRQTISFGRDTAMSERTAFAVDQNFHQESVFFKAGESTEEILVRSMIHTSEFLVLTKATEYDFEESRRVLRLPKRPITRSTATSCASAGRSPVPANRSRSSAGYWSFGRISERRRGQRRSSSTARRARTESR